MLACDLSGAPDFPILASPKLDGVRATCQDGMFRTRSLKSVPNQHIQSKYVDLLEGLDGELIIGCDHEEGTFRRTTSGVMSRAGEPEFTFNVFDCFTATNYSNRYLMLKCWFESGECNEVPWLKLIHHQVIYNQEQLDNFVAHCMDYGYEGVVLRKIDGAYKNGRATKKEGTYLRIKPWADAEAEIIDFFEGQHNENVATINELGRTQRSTHSENMVNSGRLGAFLVRDLKTGVEFKIGNGKGLTHELREEIWNNQEKFKSKLIKYKHVTVGGYDKPRIAQFLGFRDRDDLGG